MTCEGLTACKLLIASPLDDRLIMLMFKKGVYMTQSSEMRALDNRELLKQQILAIRDSGRTNMFDINYVKYLASEQDFLELVLLIDEKPSKYYEFIIKGDENLLLD